MQTVCGFFVRRVHVIFMVCVLVFMLAHSMSPPVYVFSPMWMQPCGRSWLRGAASFIAMMTAMMLPSFAPALLRVRGWCERVRMSVAYFGVWAAFGAVVYACAPLLPFMSMSVVILAGFVQASEWKARRLACCRATSAKGGFIYGVNCVLSCAPLTAVLLVTGAMNPWIMLLMTIVINAERLAPNGADIAKAVGVLTMLTGIVFSSIA